MAPPSSEGLVYTASEDGIALTGIAIRPGDGPIRPVAIVWMHGNTGSFCDYPYVTLGRALARRGYCFVSGNSRGHDIGATLWQVATDRPIAGGSAWERLEESPHDLAAWVDLAMEGDARGVVLVGHSLGAVKVIRYQAERQDPRIAGVALASPDLHGHWPGEIVERARRLVTEGRATELLPPLMGAHWYRLSAGNVVSRATVQAQTYTADPAGPSIARLRLPLLALYGDRDVGGEAELATIRAAARAARVTSHLIAGADHVYTGREEEAAALIAGWAESLL